MAFSNDCAEVRVNKLRSEGLRRDRLEELSSRFQNVQASPKEIGGSLALKCVLWRRTLNSLAPVSHLPNEVLLIIFETFVQLSSEGDHCDLAHPEITISHTASHWRNLAVNAPSLWTQILLTPRTQHHLEFFETYLRRSANMLVNVDIRDWAHTIPVAQSYYECSSADRHVSHTVVDALLPFVHRIRTLNVSKSGTPVLSTLFRVFDTSSSIPSSCSFTALTTLTIDNRKNDTHIGFRQLLSASPNIITLTFIGQVFDANEMVTAIELPFLQKLTLNGGSYANFDCHALKVIDTLSAPSLRHLELQHLKMYWTEDAVSRVFFTKDASPRFTKVRTLVICDKVSRETEYAGSLIKAFPLVTHVTLGGSVIGGFASALEELLALRSGVEIWPYLEALDLTYLPDSCLLPIHRWLKTRRTRRLSLHVQLHVPVWYCYPAFPRHVKKLQKHVDVRLEDHNRVTSLFSVEAVDATESASDSE
ncbi:hypothetical protein BV22DRAFT_471740 [Leucogyrophana mollusca]|uniref:Uncharacterized protein n=1 Tax=Leucogyrophana mollusca TaxID=85980 RepID=A0ACB8BHL6_9AGAM|nr:hypothetical protein BV22DRAFT_471740 [Leucogyrophana mollusca]